jgi:hypothetical protein
MGCSILIYHRSSTCAMALSRLYTHPQPLSWGLYNWPNIWLVTVQGYMWGGSKLLLQIPAALELEKCIFQQSIKLSLVAATQTRGLWGMLAGASNKGQVLRSHQLQCEPSNSLKERWGTCFIQMCIQERQQLHQHSLNLPVQFAWAAL